MTIEQLNWIKDLIIVMTLVVAFWQTFITIICCLWIRDELLNAIDKLRKEKCQ